jgi:branched-chain amino acid transport system substrate-binding protein
MIISRRGLLAAVSASAVPFVVRAQGAAPLRIGVLNDESGVFADTSGLGSVLSAKLAAADFGGRVAGRPIEILAADHQNKADVGSAIARDWFDNHGVDAIADLGNSGVALAVASIAHQKGKAVLISAGGSTALTGSQCAPTTVQWTYDTWSNATTLARTMMRQGGDTWFFVTADYSFGHNLQNEATEVIVKDGGKVLGSVVHPIGTADFSAYLLQAQASGAKVIALANGGEDTGRSLKQAREFGIMQTQRMVGFAAMITDVHALGLPTAEGLILTETFYWDLNDKTRAFGERWSQQNRGRMPDMMQAGVYSVVLHYLEAVQVLGQSADGAAVVARMKSVGYDDPLFGKSSIRADGRAVHDAYTFRAKSPGQSSGPWDLYDLVATLPGEETLRPMKDGGCNMDRS